MHLCCDRLCDVRSVLNEKIKPISNDVLSPMLLVTEQYTVRAKSVGQMKYTVNDSCFHRLIDSINQIDGFSTSVYRKPTFTGLFTNFDSFIPLSFKRGLIYSLLNRYFRICSSYHIFHSEVLKLKEFFVNNGYPVALFDRCLSIFLDKIFSPPINNITVPKRVVYFHLPFTSAHSLQIQTKLIKLVSSCFPQIDLCVVLKPGKCLSTFFQFKDPVPKFLKSHVVHQFKCQCCAALYIGQTCHHQHMGILPLTGKKVSHPSCSSILTHSTQTNHSISFHDFSILSSSNSPLELLIRESLLINKHKPSLNENITSVLLALF